MEARKLYNNDVGQTTLRGSASSEIVPDTQPYFQQLAALKPTFSSSTSTTSPGVVIFV